MYPLLALSIFTLAIATKMNVFCREADRQMIRVENETGSAYLTNYVIYPGISIAYMDAHIQEFSCYARLKPGVFAINHCEEGPIECNFKKRRVIIYGKRRHVRRQAQLQ